MLDYRKIESIEGWLTKNEALFLFENAKKVMPENNIVEIGSWKGRSTICLGMGSKEGLQAQIYAVDPHVGSSEHQQRLGKVNTFGEFLYNIKTFGVDEFIKPVRNDSVSASKTFDKEIELLFVDGAHEYNFVKEDFKHWFPKLKAGGIIAFHDAWYFNGPRLFSYFLLMTSSEVKKPKQIDTIICFEKTKENSFLNRFYNIIFIPYSFFVGGLLGSLRMYFFGMNETKSASNNYILNP